LDPGGGVVEVEAAGGVEGVLAGAGGEDRFVVVVVAGAVEMANCHWLAEPT
jgi:hypothetical protein